MRKTFFSIIFFAVAFFAGCEKYDKAIQDLNDRIDHLEGSLIASIEEQITNITSSLADLQKVDERLAGLIDSLDETAADLQSQLDNNSAADAASRKALEDELAAVNALINALQKEDAALDTKISELKTYVDQLKASSDKDLEDTKAWVSATFATLEQYEEMQTSIATISALVDAYKAELEAGYTEAIEAAVSDMQDAIKTSEKSIKRWVNNILANDYYDIAEIDALLTALETKLAAADAELAKQIAVQSQAIKQASKNLTAAYEKAIKDAITENNGKISAEIAAAVEGELDDIHKQINTIKDDIKEIEDRLKDLEDMVEGLIARIQSIRFLPKYSDGKVELPSDNSLSFIISPNSAAQVIATAWQTDPDIVTAYLSRTQSRTRAADAPTRIGVTQVTGTADGMLTVVVSTNALPADYWTDTKDANLFIRISDDNNDIISEMIPATYVYPYVTFSAESEQTFSWQTPPTECSLSTRASGTEEFEYSVGEDDWETLSENQIVTFGGTNGTLRLRGTAPNGTNVKEITFGNPSTLVACSGDIRTLVDWENYAQAETGQAKFQWLFNECAQLTSAPALPATELAANCYYGMFYGCENLTSAPALPATELAEGCYYGMFAFCTQLTSAPELPATKMKAQCYQEMFYNTSLAEAPELPADVLAEECYRGMLAATPLVSAPVLPATELAKGCYYGMFDLCDNLTSSPELKATILVDKCYSHMFYGCQSLSKVTMLATDHDDTGSDYFKDWLHNVAAAGTVYVKEGSEIQLPLNDASGIPLGWNVVSRQSSAGLDDFGFGGSLTGK